MCKCSSILLLPSILSKLQNSSFFYCSTINASKCCNIKKKQYEIHQYDLGECVSVCVCVCGVGDEQGCRIKGLEEGY